MTRGDDLCPPYARCPICDGEREFAQIIEDTKAEIRAALKVYRSEEEKQND